MISMPPNLQPDDPHRVRVYWEDTDAGGIVYHANYLKFFERARTEWMRRCGVGQEQLRQANIIIVARSITIDYKTPAVLDDVLDVMTMVTDLKKVSAMLMQSIGRDDTVCATASVSLAFLDATTKRPAKLPEEVLVKITPHLKKG